MAFRGLVLACVALAVSLPLCAAFLEEAKGLHGNSEGRWIDVKLGEDVSLDEALTSLPKVVKRAATGDPVVNGVHKFEDRYTYARIHYSGDNSDVIFVLTYQLRNGIPIRSNLYRSTNYGSSFTKINDHLDSDPNLVLSQTFFFSDFNKNLLIFPHATAAILYYTLDEGQTFIRRNLSLSSINPRSIRYHPSQDGWMLARDSSSSLHVTSDYGMSWKRVDDNVVFYQWADQKWDSSKFLIYYTTRDPTNANLTVNLYKSDQPYKKHSEFDPDFGDHDAFLIVGPYIFAQRTDSGVINLYVSYNRKPFQQAKIPTPYAHQGYLVSHINELQALVVIEHEGNFYNLYLSDLDGAHYSLTLRDIVVERRNILDLEQISGVNGTLIANQYVRDDPSQTSAPIRTLITHDKGGIWQLVLPPDEDVDGDPITCVPPDCSLHFHMDTSEYARLGVYSTSSAPGIIVAHGNTGQQLTDDPNLYISRDGGVTWEETLARSWGVNVADHGGLMVAARDYHQTPSNEVMYSCDEGYSWTRFTFDNETSTIYGVITEPGQHTTIMSLYGLANRRDRWIVITIDFAHIFNKKCGDSDYTVWIPWDAFSDTDCILGSSVSIERRKAKDCCLNGRDYVREFKYTICDCNIEDFECDYGYARPPNDLSGTCQRDSSVELPDPCANGVTQNYTASSGYRKIAGDVCSGGVEYLYAPITAPCCGNSTLPPTPRGLTTAPPSTGGTNPTSSKSSGSGGVSSPTIGIAVLLGLVSIMAVVILIILVFVSVKFSSLRSRYFRLATAGEEPTQQFIFHSDRDSSLEDPAQDEEDDDAPIVP